jgi:hypothetical protein
MRRGSVTSVGGTLRFALPAVAFAAIGWGAASSAALPAAEELVPNTVARISDVPDRPGTITKAEFRHSLALAAAAQRRPLPKPGGRAYERLKRNAMHTLLETVWLKGQAAEMNILVTSNQVKSLLALIKAQSFKSRAEYLRFLRKSHLTRRDVHERVELELISIRIQERIVRDVRSRAEEQKALRDFVAEFNQRWRSRTVCASQYVIDKCSNGPG